MPSRIDTLIADCTSWNDFRDLASRQKNTKDMGDLFERLTQIYLQTHPTYRSKIKTVWWCNNDELPEEVRRKLNLPETDEGIDLLCETYSGERAVKLKPTPTRLLAQPKSMRSIIDATQREQRHGSA